MALKKAVRETIGARPGARGDPAPACAFGLVIGVRVADLEKVVERIEAKINGLIFAVAVTALVEIGRAVLR